MQKPRAFPKEVIYIIYIYYNTYFAILDGITTHLLWPKLNKIICRNALRGSSQRIPHSPYNYVPFHTQVNVLGKLGLRTSSPGW